MERAAHSGFRYPCVGRLESGDKNIALATEEKIADGLGITLEELFKGLYHAKAPAETRRHVAFVALLTGAHKKRNPPGGGFV